MIPVLSLEITSFLGRGWLCWPCWFWEPTEVNEFSALDFEVHICSYFHVLSCQEQPIFRAMFTWNWYQLVDSNGTSLLKNRAGIQQTNWTKWTNDLQFVIFLDVFSCFRSCFTRCNLTWVHSLGGGWTNTPTHLGEYVWFLPTTSSKSKFWYRISQLQSTPIIPYTKFNHSKINEIQVITWSLGIASQYMTWIHPWVGEMIQFEYPPGKLTYPFWR